MITTQAFFPLLSRAGDELHFMDILDMATAEKKLASFTHGHTMTLLQAKRMQIDVRDLYGSCLQLVPSLIRDCINLESEERTRVASEKK